MTAKSPRQLQATPRARKLLAAASLLALSTWANPALADCVADSTGLNVVCSGTSAPYSNTASGVTVTAQSGGTVTGPMTIGNSANVSNGGTFNGAAGSAALTVGANSAVTNLASATFTQANGSAGSEGVVLGDNSSLTNNGTMTAATGINLARFGKGGTFLNTAAATGLVSGNFLFGTSTGADVSQFTNLNTTFGVTGNIAATGNFSFTNGGKYAGAITQTSAAGSTVTLQNQSAGTFAGTINTADVTTLNNAGLLTINAGSVIGGGSASGSLVNNTGTLNVGNGTTVPVLTINGNYVQSAAGTLGVTIRLPGTLGPIAGANYAQLQTLGSAALNGNLALTVTSGFYPTGSVYNVVVGNTGVTGNFSSVTGNSLPFITFVPIGVVTLSGSQQAYQLQVQRTTSYAAALGTAGTANQIAIANGFQRLVTTANAAPNSAAASLVGAVDVLTVAQAQTFFDTVSPAPYLAYVSAMRDHANLFQRKIALRATDQNSDHAEKGWWASFGSQALGNKATGTTKSKVTSLDVAAGYDFSGPNHVFGAALGYSRGTLKYGGGNLDGNDNAYQAGLYGGVNIGPLIANAQVSYLLGNMSAKKVATIGTATRTTTVRSRESLLTATGTLGARVDVGGFALLPFVGIETQRGSIRPFTETGAGAANLTVSRLKADRTDLLAGATLTASKGKWRPYAKGTYRSLIGTAPSNGVTAYFNGDPATTFTVNGLGAAKHEVDVDAGLNIVFDDEGGLFLGYQGTFRNDMTNHGIWGGIRLEF